jgi:uncharacterized protein
MPTHVRSERDVTLRAVVRYSFFQKNAKTNIQNMKKYWIGLLSALVAWAAVGCGGSKKAVTYPPEKIVPTDQSLLWRISGNGLKKPSYLYGTIHMIPKSELEFSEAVLRSLDQSERIVFEIDMKEMTNFRTQISLMTKAFMKNGQTLKKLLPPDDYQYVHAKLEEKGMGMGMFERIKPMFLSVLLASDEEQDGPKDKSQKMTSVEMELYKLARKRKIKSGGLETVDFQMSVFDSIPYKAQAEMLVDGLRSAEAGIETNDDLASMLKMYKSQDITAMQQLIGQDSSAFGAYESVLLSGRNRNWIPAMGRMMLLQPTFFAVGAGHLGGTEGVVALLRKAGYRVEAVF